MLPWTSSLVQTLAKSSMTKQAIPPAAHALFRSAARMPSGAMSLGKVSDRRGRSVSA